MLLGGILATGLSFAAQPGTAVDAEAAFTYAIDAGIGRSDNLTRVPAQEIAENITTAGLELDLNRTGRRLNADLVGNLRYFDYLENTYESELTGRFDGTVDLGILPERLNWVVEDNYGQASTDIFAVQTPATREYINYFSTGPDLLMNFGANGYARLFGRYALASYEVSSLDGDRRQVGLTAGRRLSNNGSISLNLVGERLQYDDPAANADYDREQAFIRYEGRGARTRITLDAGYTKIEGLSYTDGGATFRLEVSRTVSASSTLSFTGGVRMTDSSDRFRMSELGAISGPQSAVVTATPEAFENRFASAGWAFSRNRTNLGITVAFNNDVYERSAQLGRKRTAIEANLRRQLTRALSARLVGAYTMDKFDAPNSDFDEWRAGAGARLALGRNMFLNLDADHYRRTADSPLNEYVENRAFLTIGYESR